MVATLKVLMLGSSQFGKTTFLASMYGAMSRGVSGFTLSATDFAQKRQLSRYWTEMEHNGRLPNGTLHGVNLRFDCAYNFNTITHVEWYDFPGDWMNSDSERTEEQYECLLSYAKDAHVIMLCLPAHLLLDSIQCKRAMTAFSNYNDFTMDLIKRRDRDNASGTYLPHIVYIITMADYITHDETIINSSFDKMMIESPFSHAEWGEIGVIAV